MDSYPGDSQPARSASPDGEAHRSRRGFVDWLLGTSMAGFVLAVLYPVSRYVVPPKATESATSTVTLPFGPGDLAPSTARAFKFGSKPGIIVRTSTGELKAYSALCTHLGCIIQYRKDLGHFFCACHGGQFDLNGVNIGGPPPRPLDAYVVNVRGDQIIVSKAS
jgi:cytochrome b6-f complex iron-sulfur subunit